MSRRHPKRQIQKPAPKPEIIEKPKKQTKYTLILAIVAIGVVLVDAAVWMTQPQFPLLIIDKFAAIIGLPMSAIASLILVVFLHESQGKIEFEILGMKFRGASGPVVMWIFSFLAMAFAIKIMW
jgi:hypothetical protein